ncbi:ornithine cyclodeaminase family protein [Mangrovicella endophytica]|uniref:ornithine cyclodeaminase family protein n=1 Tax=Mangrovicella endophytica TaxID=2066697 RepID=UPI000C9DFE64|nr:ornithine cyclodeaminase [Mangrovicella endophytica]
MRTIRFEDADPLLDWQSVVDAIEAGHRLPKAKIGDLLMRHEQDSLLSRGAWIEGLGVALKSVTIFPANASQEPPLPSVQGAMLLFDPRTGALEAVIDGILVTKWKTAGDSALGARLLARPDSRHLVICGAGTLARSLIDAYRAVMPDLARITLWNRTLARAEALATECESLDLSVVATSDLAAAVAEADIVACATMATEPFLRGEWVRPGTHIDLIGAYRPDMREADDALIAGAELFVDSRETTLEHIGELKDPIARGIITAGHVRGDLYDLCNGGAGRSDAQTITVFKNGGGAHLDLMTGALIKRVVEVSG